MAESAGGCIVGQQKVLTKAAALFNLAGQWSQSAEIVLLAKQRKALFGGNGRNNLVDILAGHPHHIRNSSPEHHAQ